MTPIPPPTPLLERGQALWDAVNAEFELGSKELALLFEVCATVDELHRLRISFWEEERTVVRGSKRQSVVNPLVGALKSHRELFASLLTKLQAEGEEGASIRSDAGRKAAEARWGRQAPRVL